MYGRSSPGDYTLESLEEIFVWTFLVHYRNPRPSGSNLGDVGQHWQGKTPDAQPRVLSSSRSKDSCALVRKHNRNAFAQWAFIFTSFADVATQGHLMTAVVFSYL